MNKQKLRSLPLFSSLTEAEAEEFLSTATYKETSYHEGELIARQGSSVRSLMVLMAGSARGQMINEEGKRLTIDHMEAPTLMASAFLYARDNHFPVEVEASSNGCEILYLNRDDFQRAMARYPGVLREFLRDISDKCLFLTQKLNALNLQSLRERLLNHLREQRQIGTQEELALLLGVARPSLSRVLSELVKEGLVHKQDDHYLLV